MPISPCLSMQLYSARKFSPVEAQLAAIRANGFEAVETFGPFHDDPAATRRMLDANGLTARSAHVGLEMLESQPARAVDIARTLGAEIVVAPYLTPPQRPTAPQDWSALGARLSEIAGRLAGEGLRFAWHNHDFELVALPDGSYPLQRLLGDTVLWEADLAWVVCAGADPRPWVERYSGRIPIVHVKDIAPAGDKIDEDGWADLGTGILPWPELWARCVAAGAEIMVAEHDNPSDFGRFARVGAEAMRRFAAEASS